MICNELLIDPRLDIVNLDIVNKTQLLSWDFIETLCLDIVNKRDLTGSFTISSLGCTR